MTGLPHSPVPSVRSQSQRKRHLPKITIFGRLSANPAFRLQNRRSALSKLSPASKLPIRSRRSGLREGSAARASWVRGPDCRSAHHASRRPCVERLTILRRSHRTCAQSHRTCVGRPYPSHANVRRDAYLSRVERRMIARGYMYRARLNVAARMCGRPLERKSYSAGSDEWCDSGHVSGL